MSRQETGNFRQLRITATHELPTANAPWGRFSVAVYAKPLNTPWVEQHLVMRRSIWGPRTRLESVEEVASACVEILQELYLQPELPLE